jgi:hypothetical protein
MLFGKLPVMVVISAFVVAGSFLMPGNDSAARFHTPQELDVFRSKRSPIGAGQYFLPSYRCQGCHGLDSSGFANVNENGEDVNLYDHWKATMMAQSGRDPLWRAKVMQEITVNPSHAAELQDKCTSCHAPMGHYNAKLHGAAHYSLAQVLGDSLGLDGVSCSGCHTINTQGIGHVLGQSFSGDIPFDTTRKIYGPFQNPFLGPMNLYEGYTPVYSQHMSESKVCSSCHTLITSSADLNGNPTGIDFVEQATYHEYLNSTFPANNITCQTCHMPTLPDAVVIANGNINYQARYPFNQHRFSGANHFMLNLMKDNRQALGIDATDAHYDTVITYTDIMLQQRSVDLTLLLDSISSDTAFYKVKLKNKAGHKFPSGYPSRRAVLQFVVTGALPTDTIFRSGTFTSDFRVVGEPASFEPHHQIISQNDRPQIYEMIMGDVNNQYTSVLERGTYLLKDNRLPPQGFTTTHPVYDTVQVSADALADPDFNKNQGVEGTGEDFVYYHVPLNGHSGFIQAGAKMFYQAVPPRFLDEMFALPNPHSLITDFQSMYQSANRSPYLMVSDQYQTTVTKTFGQSLSGLSLSPTICRDGRVNVIPGQGHKISSVEVFDPAGRKIQNTSGAIPDGVLTISLPETRGTYLIRIRENGKIHHFKVFRF